MLGCDLARLAADRYEVIACGHHEADVTHPAMLLHVIEEAHPSVVVNCAAWTDVDGAERHAAEAEAVNAVGAGNVAEAASCVGARLVHISTDYVFDGAKDEPYAETDKPHPLSVYGWTKLEGERAVLSSAPEALIVRTAWLYGAGRRNFVTNVLERGRVGETLRMTDDQFSSPTWTVDLATAVLALVDVSAQGVVHFVNAGRASRFEEAREALRLAGVKADLRAIKAAEFPQPAARPHPHSVLGTALYARLTGKQPRAWPEALTDYLAQLARG